MESKQIQIAILSDLHCMFGEANKYEHIDSVLFSNMLPYGNQPHPITALLSLIKKEKIKCDYLLCPGDITNKMDIQGFISGFHYLEEIKSSIEAKELICTPGNHDVDFLRNHSSILPRALDSLKYVSDNYPLKDKKLSNKLIDDGYCIYSDDDVIILCLNTVLNYTDSQSSKIIDLSRIKLAEIQNEIQNINPQKNRIQIVMSHHHPLSISNSNYRVYDDSDWIKNGDVIIDELSEYGFSFFIHGHKHKPKFYSHNKMNIFCAGSFSAQQNLRIGDDANSFHTINFSLNDSLKGYIETWTFCHHSNSWEKTSLGFPSIRGFGALQSPEDLVSLFLQTYPDFNTQPDARVDYDIVIKKIPEIEFLEPHSYNEFENLLNQKKIFITNLGGIKTILK